MKLIRQTDISAMETPGGNHTSALVTTTLGAKEICVFKQRQQPGGQNPPHYHDREEVLLVQSGTITVTVDQQEVEMTPGDVLIVPEGVVHSVTTNGNVPSEWLLVARAGLRFFRPDGEEAFAAWAQ
jgi:quercetin dioxygenase-like cupin family protein